MKSVLKVMKQPLIIFHTLYNKIGNILEKKPTSTKTADREPAALLEMGT